MPRGLIGDVEIYDFDVSKLLCQNLNTFVTCLPRLPSLSAGPLFPLMVTIPFHNIQHRIWLHIIVGIFYILNASLVIKDCQKKMFSRSPHLIGDQIFSKKILAISLHRNTCMTVWVHEDAVRAFKESKLKKLHKRTWISLDVEWNRLLQY